jgi:hypothetical protein
VRLIIGTLGLALLLAGCAPQRQSDNGHYNGYGLAGGPGGIGSAQGPMPYGDINGAVGGSGWR